MPTTDIGPLDDDAYELLTSADLAAVRAEHPMKSKKGLARLLVERFHGAASADAAAAYFESTFSKKELPTDLSVVKVPASTRNEIASTAVTAP